MKEFLQRCRCNTWFPGGSAQVQRAGAKNKGGTPAPEREVYGAVVKTEAEGLCSEGYD